MNTNFSRKVYDMAVGIVDEALNGKFRDHPAREYFMEELSYELGDIGTNAPQSLKITEDTGRVFFVNLDRPFNGDDLAELSEYLDEFTQNKH